ncbi:hypothetical protein [Shewanella violacea]|uniref:Auto-transporter adhesin head GIN domain-containing protein n=1 Tax=Shewanella violacea (strain JCM 10179 / CIP 106290 / LMG 19151 / DSS12) TaxID=637905 RepID=D4ZAI9_SHEVD|nr:hypothetical protein [Shewanella violacea]BAJ03034.1 conserved hypothetical protein [Shewanella violacea DSS12]
MKFSITRILVLALALISFQGLAAAEWVKIADKTVDYKTETDTVTPQFREKNVTHIKLKCTQGSVNLHKLVLNMSDGTSKTVDNLGVLTKGLASRSISVPKGDIKLESIDFTYDSVGSQTMALAGLSKKGKLDIMGKKPAQKD